MLGCDIIEVFRIEDSVKKLGENFIRRILTKSEIEIYHRRKENKQFLAGRFAAKEAVSKAFRTGIGETISFTDIEILPDDFGAPVVYIKGEQASNIELSISHCNEYAMAVCLKAK